MCLENPYIQTIPETAMHTDKMFSYEWFGNIACSLVIILFPLIFLVMNWMI